MPNIKFDIIKNIGILSEGSRDWKKEVNIMSWNGRKAKMDIRDWDGKHEKMGKGITLDKEEILKLRDLLNKIDIDEMNIE
ncbi:YdbC family protein [Clostridium sp. LBM24168]